MADSALDIYAKLVITILAIVGFGYRAYIAWFIPAEHEDYLSRQRHIAQGWFTKEEPRPVASFTNWFFRISYTILSLLMVGILLWIIVPLMRS